ncbi:MAG: Tad domain-containing protein [Chloroflexi bacterium]|nr:Tad domain-containing protein [Chloroflexota bacterium]
MDEVTSVSEAHHRQRGQVWVFVAILMLVLLGILAVALDGSNAYLNRRQAQNAADAGALAGARLLALGASPAEVEAAATEYAVQRNGADSCQVTILGNTVRVSTTKRTSTFFAGVVGISEVEALAEAAATFGAPDSAGGLRPIAIKNFPYVYGEEYAIWDDNPDEDPNPETTHIIAGSYRGWLNLSCAYPASCSVGSDDLKEWMANGYQGTVQVGSWLRGDPGTRASVLKQAQVGTEVIIAVYDDIRNLYPGKEYYHVIKFAVFHITEVKATGNPKYIEGRFIRHVQMGNPSGGPDGGLRVVRLTK